MKLLAATTALSAVLACSPAFAQQSPPAPTPEANATEGTLKVEGIAPSKVLGAIDTKKLVQEESAADAKVEVQSTAEVKPEPQAPLAKTADAQGVTQVPDPADKTHSDTQSAATADVGVDTGKLPVEVAAAISDGKYTTKDLVQAQLSALESAPPLVQPVITTTVTTQPASDDEIDADTAPTQSRGAPVFDGAARPGDWSQSAGTPVTPETATPPG